MKTPALTLLIATLCLGLLGWQKPVIQTASFSDLPHGETLLIHFHSSGCFNQDDYELVYRRGATSTIDVTEDPGTKSAHTFPRIELSNDDLARLDNLLHFYRTVKDGGCTTRDTVTITELRGKTIVATETHMDGSCSLHDMAGALTFPDLCERASAKQPNAP